MFCIFLDQNNNLCCIIKNKITIYYYKLYKESLLYLLLVPDNSYYLDPLHTNNIIENATPRPFCILPSTTGESFCD